MMRSTGLVQVDEILITHLHADHYLGPAGAAQDLRPADRPAPLRIAGPPGLHGLFEALRRIFGRIRYEVELVELERGGGARPSRRGFRDAALRGRAPHAGLRLRARRARAPGPLRRGAGEAARRRPTSADFGRLQRGEAVPVDGGEVTPDQVIGEARTGRKVVITGDTAPCEMTRVAAHAAQLLVHDGTLHRRGGRPRRRDRPLDGPAGRRARRRGRGRDARAWSTSPRATTSAACSRRPARPSPRRTPPRDFDLVEIPFPERGDPVLVENGARDRPEPAASS